MAGNNVRRRGRDIDYTWGDLHDGTVLRLVSIRPHLPGPPHIFSQLSGRHASPARSAPPACHHLTRARPRERPPGQRRRGQAGRGRFKAVTTALPTISTVDVLPPPLSSLGTPRDIMKLQHFSRWAGNAHGPPSNAKGAERGGKEPGVTDKVSNEHHQSLARRGNTSTTHQFAVDIPQGYAAREHPVM
jgi:hypothetical protein